MKNEAPQIAIFGEALTRRRVAHQEIATACLEDPALDEVWIMPSGERYDKRIGITDQMRLEMLQAMKQEVFGDEPRLHISDFELNLPQPTQTYRTVGALALQHSDARFWYVYGADSYAGMPSWQQGKELQQNLALLLIPRSGYELPPPNSRIKHLAISQIGPDNISSTEARRRVTAGEAIGKYVCGAVCSYVEDNALYKDSSLGVPQPRS